MDGSGVGDYYDDEDGKDPAPYDDDGLGYSSVDPPADGSFTDRRAYDDNYGYDDEYDYYEDDYDEYEGSRSSGRNDSYGYPFELPTEATTTTTTTSTTTTTAASSATTAGTQSTTEYIWGDTSSVPFPVHEESNYDAYGSEGPASLPPPHRDYTGGGADYDYDDYDDYESEYDGSSRGAGAGDGERAAPSPEERVVPSLATPALEQPPASPVYPPPRVSVRPQISRISTPIPVRPSTSDRRSARPLPRLTHRAARVPVGRMRFGCCMGLSLAA